MEITNTKTMIANLPDFEDETCLYEADVKGTTFLRGLSFFFQFLNISLSGWIQYAGEW